MQDSVTKNNKDHKYPPPGTEESKARYRQVAELWRKAAEDDWRGPVRIDAEWHERAVRDLERLDQRAKERKAKQVSSINL